MLTESKANSEIFSKNRWITHICIAENLRSFSYPGRAIRHRGDYATILLLDQRYGSARIQRSLPGWISNRLQHHARFGSAFAAIRKVS